MRGVFLLTWLAGVVFGLGLGALVLFLQGQLTRSKPIERGR